MGPSRRAAAPELTLRTAGGTAFRLRPVRPDDEGFLHDLHVDRADPELALAGLLEMQFRAQRLGYQAEFPDAEDWVVVLDGVLVGRLLWDRRPTRHHIVDVGLLGRHRGRGIGTALLTEAKAEAARAGVPVNLTVEARDERLLRWYQGLGFTVESGDGVHLRLAWDPTDAH